MLSSSDLEEEEEDFFPDFFFFFVPEDVELLDFEPLILDLDLDDVLPPPRRLIMEEWSAGKVLVEAECKGKGELHAAASTITEPAPATAQQRARACCRFQQDLMIDTGGKVDMLRE